MFLCARFTRSCGITNEHSEVSRCQIDEVMSILDKDGDGSISKKELEHAFEQDIIPGAAGGRGRAGTYVLPQTLQLTSLLKFDDEESGNGAKPGEAKDEARMVVEPSVTGRHRVGMECGFSEEQSPWNPAKLAKLTCSYGSFELDRCEVRRLKWNGEVKELESTWGNGGGTTETAVDPLFDWPNEVGGFISGVGAVRVPRAESNSLY